MISPAQGEPIRLRQNAQLLPAWVGLPRIGLPHPNRIRPTSPRPCHADLHAEMRKILLHQLSFELGEYAADIGPMPVVEVLQVAEARRLGETIHGGLQPLEILDGSTDL